MVDDWSGSERVERYRFRLHRHKSESEWNNASFKAHLYEVDDVIGQPKHDKGSYDHQDEATPLSSALEAGTLQAADDRGVAGVDKGERD